MLFVTKPEYLCTQASVGVWQANGEEAIAISARVVASNICFINFNESCDERPTFPGAPRRLYCGLSRKNLRLPVAGMATLTALLLVERAAVTEDQTFEDTMFVFS